MVDTAGRGRVNDGVGENRGMSSDSYGIGGDAGTAVLDDDSNGGASPTSSFPAMGTGTTRLPASPATSAPPSFPWLLDSIWTGKARSLHSAAPI